MRVLEHRVDACIAQSDRARTDAAFDEALRAATAAAWTHRANRNQELALYALVARRMDWCWADRDADAAREVGVSIHFCCLLTTPLKVCCTIY